MKKRLLIFIAPFLLTPLIIGSAFAVFYFDKSSINKDQNIDVDITNNPDIGDIKLVYKDDEGNYQDELMNTEFKNQVFMGDDSVYFIRNDNISVKRDFTLLYTKPKTVTSIFHQNVALYCDIAIKDSDERGIKIEKFTDSLGEERFFPYSNSILDIFKPSIVLYENWDDTFELIRDGKTNDKNATYRAKVRTNLLETTVSNNLYTTFTLELNYLNYSVINNGERIEGNMAPSLSESSASYIKKMNANKLALLNSELKISFHLDLVDKN